jgi:hypothetical protein
VARVSGGQENLGLRKVAVTPIALTDEALDRMMRDGKAQIALIDQMEAALLADDVAALKELARKMVRWIMPTRKRETELTRLETNTRS